MALLFISEYRNMATDAFGKPIPIGEEPAVVTQVVAVTTPSTPSAAFNSSTRFIKMHSDTTCHIEFGTAPVAVAATDHRLVAGTTEFFGVIPGSALKVACITP